LAGRRRCEPHCTCGLHNRAKKEATVVAEARGCACGCGKLAKPGSRYVVGHAARAKANRAMFGLPPELVERALAQPLTSRCDRCSWSAEGPAREAIKAFRTHPCVADRAPFTA
jgi:hypothetical protein